MNVLTCSLTEAGAAVARRLPYDRRHGDLVATVAARWADVDAFVLICATGIAVRAIAPLLADKASDPAVVCVDDAARWVIALAGGHQGGANDLARNVAAVLGGDAQAVVTTATDAAGLPALDSLPGFTAEGDVAAVTRRWLDGTPPVVVADPGLADWPAPLARGDGDGPVRITDRLDPPPPGQVFLRPRSLVVGVGASSGADPDGLERLVRQALEDDGLHAAAVGLLATVEAKRHEPAVVALAQSLGVPLRAFPADALASVETPNPSQVVAMAVGTPSVAEAAAVLAAGQGATLIVEKRKRPDATVAVARRRRPEGHLAVVGLGPGDAAHRTPAAAAAVRHADAVLGYGPYVDLAADLLSPRQTVVRFAIGAEQQRCAAALSRAAAGEQVALVCSGDAGVYAMASLVYELAPAQGDPPVSVVPGITAALAAAAALGAPLGHDHASVSLSDLLTPWTVIERRLVAAAEGDFVVSLYNPRSQRRTSQLEDALTLLAKHRPPDTPAAIVSEVGRPAARIVRTTLADLDPAAVGMLSLVVIGATTTRWIGERMVTPRGYPSP